MKLCVWNVGSLNNKIDDLISVFTDGDTDVAIIPETWLTSQGNKTTATLKEQGYKINHVIRNDPERERGGGVGIITKKSIKTKPVKTKMFSSFQHVGVQLPHTNNNNKLIVVCIYRLLYVHVITFLQEFAEFLEIISISSNNLIIAGDINIHMETQEMPSIELTKLLDMFNLKQHVSKPTHIHGHTIDAVITRLDDPNYIENMMIEHLLGIHHFKISFVTHLLQNNLN